MNCTISIALAAYNGAEYITTQLKSLLDQSRKVNEIVISDDSPDDATLAAVTPFLSDARVIYLKNHGIKGTAGNFENALRHCSGDYIFLCDQDDWWRPDKVAKLSQILDEKPDVDAVFCNSLIVSENLEFFADEPNLFAWRNFPDEAVNKVNESGALPLFLQHITVSSHNIAFRRKWLEKLMPFPELTPFYPDTWLGLAIAAAGKWYALDECLTLYRLHRSNQSSPDSSPLAGARRARAARAAYRSSTLAEEIVQRFDSELPAENRLMLQKYAAFQLARDNYSKSFMLRALQILPRLLSGQYCRYANSLATAAADLLIAPPPEK